MTEPSPSGIIFTRPDLRKDIEDEKSISTDDIKFPFRDNVIKSSLAAYYDTKEDFIKILKNRHGQAKTYVPVKPKSKYNFATGFIAGWTFGVLTFTLLKFLL